MAKYNFVSYLLNPKNWWLPLLVIFVVVQPVSNKIRNTASHFIFFILAIFKMFSGNRYFALSLK